MRLTRSTLRPTPTRPVLKLEAEGAASSAANGERNQRSVKEILFRPPWSKNLTLPCGFLGEEENATSVQDWGPHGLVGSVAGNPPRYPGRTGSAFRFPQGAGMTNVKHHRTMRMGSSGAYTFNAWLRMVSELSRGLVPAVMVVSIISLGNNNANGGFIHHRFKMGSNWNQGVTDAYRVSPLAWTMVTYEPGKSRWPRLTSMVLSLKQYHNRQYRRRYFY